MPLCFPRISKLIMRNAYACPGENITETTERKEPIENGALERFNVRQTIERQDDEKGNERTTFLVNTHEESECVAIPCENSKSAAGCKVGRVSDEEDGNEHQQIPQLG